MKMNEKAVDIINTWKNTEKNIIVDAIPGSGKTTLLLEILKLQQEKTLFLSFNNSIKDEINNKIKDMGFEKVGKAMTLHSLGFSTIKSNFKGKVRVDSFKSFSVQKEFKSKFSQQFNTYDWEERTKILHSLSNLYDLSRIFFEFNYYKLLDISKELNKYISNDLSKSLWNKYLNFNLNLYSRNELKIDFIDMLFLPVYKKYKVVIDPVYLFIDEMQDLSKIQHMLINKITSVKRFIAVGDKRQSIYGFSGAFSDSIDNFKNKSNIIEMPLNYCYRCDKNIIKEINKVYNVVLPIKETDGIVKVITNPNEIKDNSLIICRNTKPLLELYFTLISLNKPVNFRGNDIINTLNSFLLPYKYENNFKAIESMQKELEKIKDNKLKFIFQEKFSIFKLLIKKFETKNVKELIEEIKKITKIQENSIILSTIHKAKGLGFDIVYILNENLIPNPYAKGEKALEQEKNLKYVARSRAKKELYYLNIKF